MTDVQAYDTLHQHNARWQRRGERRRQIVGTCANGAILALSLLGAVGGNPPVAWAESVPTLLCQREEVLRILERTVRGWNIYNRILDGTAVESPTTLPNAVVCHAVMRSVIYEATPAGWVPRLSEELRRYDVQITGNRLFVQVPP